MRHPRDGFEHRQGLDNEGWLLWASLKVTLTTKNSVSFFPTKALRQKKKKHQGNVIRRIRLLNSHLRNWEKKILSHFSSDLYFQIRTVSLLVQGSGVSPVNSL